MGSSHARGLGEIEFALRERVGEVDPVERLAASARQLAALAAEDGAWRREG